MLQQQQQELTEVLQRVQQWPPALRISLARRLLESLDTVAPAGRGWSAAAAIAAVNSCQPAPNDAMVAQWIDEHRTEKFAQ